MGNLLKQHSKIKKQQIKNTSVKVAHKARVISQKEINENRSSAYSFILQQLFLLERSVYNYTYKGTKNYTNLKVDVYTFKCEFNHIYIVEIEKFERNIYIIQYYLKSHSDSDNRHSLIISKDSKNNKTGAKNFLIVLNTIQDLMFSYLSRNNKASFGFIGAKSISYNKNNALNTKILEILNEDGTYNNTQRFRIYRNFIRRYFSTKVFKHIEFKSMSSYLLLNKKMN